MQCDACAGQHQQILKRANCAAEEVQAWCAWGVDPCCKEVAHADCWGFTPGADATASIQAAIDCPLAHTVVVKNMGSPWIVGLPPLRLPVTFSPLSGGVIRAAINFSTSNQLIVFQPGSVVEAKRWEFHGMFDSLFFMGSSNTSDKASENGAPVHNVTILGHNATWRMWKHDYQCTACPVPKPGDIPCAYCSKCDPTNKLYNQTQCYSKGEWRHGLNLWCGVDITIKGLRIDMAGGDGIQTGGLEAGTADSRTRNVVIQGVELSNNHRQGISVISAVGLLVEDSIMRGTNGTAPEAGVGVCVLCGAYLCALMSLPVCVLLCATYRMCRAVPCPETSPCLRHRAR